MHLGWSRSRTGGGQLGGPEMGVQLGGVGRPPRSMQGEAIGGGKQGDRCETGSSWSVAWRNTVPDVGVPRNEILRPSHGAPPGTGPIGMPRARASAGDGVGVAEVGPYGPQSTRRLEVLLVIDGPVGLEVPGFGPPLLAVAYTLPDVGKVGCT